MNGLEAVNKLKNESYCNCSLSDDNKYFCMGGLLKDSDELKAIERELKVLQILKEKKVNLDMVMRIIKQAENDKEIEDTISEIAEYLQCNYYWIFKGHEDRWLTLEEAQLIVEWLKGNKI